MKSFIYWFFGKRTGKVLIGSWNWLWAIDPESSPSQELDEGATLEAASQSLQTMEASIARLVELVNLQKKAYERAKAIFCRRLQEAHSAETQAITARNNGQLPTARLAVAKVIQLEKSLPALREQMEQAEERLLEFQTRLEAERLTLETHKSELETMRDMTEIGQAISAVREAGVDLQPEVARETFQELYSRIEAAATARTIEAGLSSGDGSSLAVDEFSQLELEDEIERRLSKLEQSPLPNRLPPEDRDTPPSPQG